MSDALDDVHENLPEQMRIRREKLNRLRKTGVALYPVGYPHTSSGAAIREKYEDLEVDHG